jgi:hypothetical protein
MNLTLKDVKPIENYNLILIFDNGERRRFDMNPFLSKGNFKELREVSKFNTVRIDTDTIVWENEADIEHSVLYKYSKAIES